MRTGRLFGFVLGLSVTAFGCSDGETSEIGGDLTGTGGNGGRGGSGGSGVPIMVGGGGGASGAGSAGSGTGGCGPNLTGLVRDFRGRDEPGGHPDFQAFTGSHASEGIVRDALGTDQKPVYNGTDAITSSEGQQTTSKARFDEWYRNTDGVNQAVELQLTFTEGANGVSTYENREFFPIDGKGFGNYEPYEDGLHNYHFTFELHTEFKYNGGETFRFLGDDDLWVFINGRLAIDLGGLHSELGDEVALDDIADEFGLIEGQKYALDLFHAERRTQHSRFRVDTSIEFTNCNPIIIPK